MKNKKAMTLWILMALWSMIGCAAINAPYGSIVRDESARKGFESFKVDPSMNYYYSGPDAIPNAIIGVKKEYQLDNDLWKPMKPNAELFEDLIQGMQSKAKEYSMSLYGFVMQDPQGNPLGVWYSVSSVKIMTLTMGTGNKVIVYTPELEVYPLPISGK